MVTELLAALLAAALAAAPTAPAAPAGPPGVEDEDLTAAVRSHPITVAKVEAYAAAVKALREAAAKDPAVAAPFRSMERFASISASAARLEAVPAVKAILDRHRVTGRDFVLTPTVILAARAAVLAERAGQGPPAPTRDPPAVALWREQGPKLEPIVTAFLADLQALARP